MRPTLSQEDANDGLERLAHAVELFVRTTLDRGDYGNDIRDELDACIEAAFGTLPIWGPDTSLLVQLRAHLFATSKESE